MKTNQRGWIVVFAGTGINLAFGVLYAWSIFSSELQSAHNWSAGEASLPYTVAIIMFAVMMIPAGKLQDKLGPRKIASIGGLLIGAGCFLAGSFTTPWGLVFCFGIMAGSGIGLGYASTTPAAIKWFPPEKKGLITGIVIGGFGMASLYVSPLSKFLLSEYGMFNSFRIMGVIFLIMTISFSQFLANPKTPVVHVTNSAAVRDIGVSQMLKTKEFYQLWFMFFAGSTGGLMIIGHLKSIAGIQLGYDAGFILVALAAIANALGRPAGGFISDRLGRGKTLSLLYFLTAAIFIMFVQFQTFLPVLLGTLIVYCCYGAMLSIYPSACGDNYGTKNLGLNYGILFSAWGVGGIFGPMLGGIIKDTTGSYAQAFYASALCLAAAAVVGLFYKPTTRK